MGSFPSCLPRYGCCVPKESPNAAKGNHTSANWSSTPKQTRHKRNLSAAFNMVELGAEDRSDLPKLNVNTCTEEELMTLPGVYRQLAHNIIAYRSKIGGFKHVEDLALVSGVGASKLDGFRMEICVNSRKNSLNRSGQDHSVETSSRASCRSQKMNGRGHMMMMPQVNINKANVFQLMKVNGLTQALAENIVMYRDKEGEFRSVEHLVKVKGISQALLLTVKSQLTIGDNDSASLCQVQIQGHHDSSSSAAKLNHSMDAGSLLAEHRADSQEELCSIYGPLGQRSFRSFKKKFKGVYKQRRVVRVATWCLEDCDEGKANNPGVREVVAMTLLENGIGILAIQDLCSEEAIKLLCEELNSPTVPNVRKWTGVRGNWMYSISSDSVCSGENKYLGFLYNTSNDIALKSSLVIDAEDEDTPRPFVGIFQLQEFDLAVVNVSLKSLSQQTDSSSKVDSQTIKFALEPVKGLRGGVILGCFMQNKHHEVFSELEAAGCVSVLHSDQCTDITVEQPEGSQSLDGLWLSGFVPLLRTGRSGVVRSGLTSPWIPHGWRWGGVVSHHCPVWAEIFCDQPPHLGEGDNQLTIVSGSDECF